MHIPVRTCIGCGTRKSKYELIRLVLAGAEGVIVDYQQRRPGRGAYLCFKSECLLEMKKRRGLDRAFRLKVSPENYAKIETELMALLQKSKLESLLGFAAKARKLAIGNEAVKQAVSRNKAKLIIIAQDATENTQRQIKYLCEKQKIPWVYYGTKNSLGSLLGKTEVVVIAVIDPIFAQNIAKLWED